MRVKSAKAQKATSMSAATSRSDRDEPTTDSSPTAVRDLGPGGEPQVRVCGLVKHFGRFRALDGLDLTVEAGSVHGFLGPEAPEALDQAAHAHRRLAAGAQVTNRGGRGVRGGLIPIRAGRRC